MSVSQADSTIVLGLDAAGILMSPEEFDAVTEYDEDYRYELVHGVLVVTPIPGAAETGPNELLGYLLLRYRDDHPQGSSLDDTLPQQYVRTRTSRRLADRLIWTGLGHLPDLRQDVPTIAVELVSAGRRNRQRDYVDKRREYTEAGIREYWIIDRFQRTMTVIHNDPDGLREQTITESQTYQTPLLPGFELPLGKILAAADQRAVRP